MYRRRLSAIKGGEAFGVAGAGGAASSEEATGTLGDYHSGACVVYVWREVKVGGGGTGNLYSVSRKPPFFFDCQKLYHLVCAIDHVCCTVVATPFDRSFTFFSRLESWFGWFAHEQSMRDCLDFSLILARLLLAVLGLHYHILRCPPPHPPAS